MQENPGSESGDLHGGAPEEVPPAPELLFEGFDARDGGAYDFPQGRAPDPRVSSLAGAANGARYKSMSPARLPITRSPCLTIPPGFSPSALLESPVLLTNIKAEPSPTTGTFSMASVLNNYVGSDRLSSPRDASKNSVCDSGSSAEFEFKPHTRQFSSSGLSSLGPLASVGLKQHEHDASAQIQSQTGIQALESSQMVKTETTNLSSHALSLSVTAPNPPVETSAFKASSPAEVAIIEPRPSKGLDNGVQSLQSDQNGSTSSAVGEKSSEDGYNWRKYGQKHVKGCAFPRSYYKCTHPNCQMKKQLERSHDGQVTEIVYKGRHDHPKPQPSRRLAIGAILSGQGEEKSDVLSSLISAADKSSSPCGHMSHHIDPNGTQDLSPVSASDDDAEVGGGHIGDDVADDDDPESKRRKKDTTTVDANPIGKANREPRVVVQTISEVDILDDGYRWRKYGQKVVKGNPNPRSYYKCTNAGCPVRKHVERASHDPKAVITTYEGKHNHDVPAARATGHETSAPSITDGAGSLNGHMSLALAGMLRTCDTRPAANPFAQPVESDTISLDLGVGISANHGSTANEQQEAPRAEQVHSRPIQFSGSDYNEVVMQAIPVSTIYGGSSNGIFGSREDTGEGFSFKSQPMNCPPNLYYSNAGNMVMGP